MDKNTNYIPVQMDEQKQSTSSAPGNCTANWKHMLLMMIGCLVPVGASLVLTQMGYTGVGSYLLFLLCPIMHLFMMRNMSKEQKKCH